MILRKAMEHISGTDTSSQPGESSGTGHFAKVLSFRDLVIYGIVFVAPIAPWGTFAYVYDLSGHAAVAAYVIGVVCMYFTAHSYKEICTQVPSSGSVYAYVRHAMGVGPGFIAGWMVLLDYLLIPALMYVIAGVALNTFLPDIPRWVWVLVFAGFSLAVNWFGIAFTARVNILFLVVQLVAVAGFLGWAVLKLKANGESVFPFSTLWSPGVTASGLFAGTSICILAFIGFDAITTLTEEVKPCQKHLIGRSIVVVLLFIGAVAVLQSWVLSALSKGFAFKDLASGVYDLTGARVSPAAGVIMAWTAATVTGIAITPPMLAAVSRVLCAMAEGGQMPKFLTVLHKRHQVPHRALAVSTALSVAIALIFAAHPDELTGIVNFGALCAYVGVHLSVLVLLGFRRRSGRWFAHVLCPIAGIVIIVAVATQMTSTALELGFGWMVFGILYYIALKAFRKSALDVSI
jgi:amino acid transporter